MYEKLHRWPDDDAVAVRDDEEGSDNGDIQPAGEDAHVIDYKQRIMPDDEY